MKTVIEKYYKTIAAVVIIVYTAVNLYCTTRLSITGDEAPYFAYGVNILKLQPQKELNEKGVPIFNSQMPIMAIAALPRAVQQLINPSLQKTNEQVAKDIQYGRIFSVISALLLALYVLVWATQLYGKMAGLFSLLLYVLCPNIMAHSQMLGTDVYSFLVLTATGYHAWRYNRTGRMQQLLLTTILLGIGQLTKQSLLLLYPVLFIFFTTGIYRSVIPLKKKILRFLKEMAVLVLVSLFVINAGFLFYKTGKPLGQYQFVSVKYKKIQQQFSFFEKLPLPLPEPFVAGFDYVQFNSQTGAGIDGQSSYGAVYFLGNKIEDKKVWYYYFVCMWYKLPIPLLIFFFAATVMFIRGKRWRSFMQDEIYLLLPAVFILSIFSLFNTMYLGIRSVLMILPLLFIFCGSIVPAVNGLVRRAAAVLLLCWQLISVALYFPHFLPYTNEFVLHKKNAHKIFTDSNIYFQEGLVLAGEYLQKHPEIQYEPAAPVHGKVMVSIENYYDWWNLGKLQWLKDMHLEPVGHFDTGYLIFEVP
jgi:4-amino-4-deoxy-L-arabinose transferase-like glycosyltransferase